jgi:beta-1,4-N-acetylglucosaminyltransferase
MTDDRYRLMAKSHYVLIAGGHTREMISIVEGLSPKLYAPRFYIYPKLDVMSRVKATKLEETRSGSSESSCISISRSREVGQGWISSVFTTLVSLVDAFYIFRTVRPQLVRTLKGTFKTLNC